MSAQVFAHPAHVHALGGYHHAHYWIERGFLTVASKSQRFAVLVPVEVIAPRNRITGRAAERSYER